MLRCRSSCCFSSAEAFSWMVAARARRSESRFEPTELREAVKAALASAVRWALSSWGWGWGCWS